MSIRAERAGNRIYLASQTPTPGLKSAIPGAYWSDAKQVWSLPLDFTTCLLLRERFGKRLEIGPMLTRWAREEKAKRESQLVVANSMTADLEVLPKVAPDLFAVMGNRPYQYAAVRFVADARGRDGRRRALIADTVGLGKTTEAIGAVLECDVPGPYLVVCPMGAVEDAWRPELLRRLPEGHQIVTLPTGRAKREKVLEELAHLSKRTEGGALANTWVVVHPAIVRTQTWLVCGRCDDRMKYRAGRIDELDCGHERNRTTRTEHDHEYPQLFSMEWGAVIADESDQMLIRLTGTPNLQRRGMEMLRDLVKPGGARIAMSGTPFRSKPHQIWSTLNWLDPVEWSGKWRFIQKYWRTGGWSGYEIVKDGFMEEREAMLLDELKTVMIRRERKEVRKDLPPKDYPSNVDSAATGLPPGIYLPMSPKQAKAYRQIEKEGEAELENGTLTPLGILAEMTRLKQFAGAVGDLDARGEFQPKAEGNKYDWLVQFMRELGFPDRPASKIVVASQYTKLLKAFGVAIGVEFRSGRNALPVAWITGEESATVRSANIARFEDIDSDLSILFINTKAGGSAITLDAADIMVVLDETEVSDEQEQLEGRIDNRNPERKIVPRSYYYLRSADTIEEGLALKNAEAKARGAKLLGGNKMTAEELRAAMKLRRKS